MVNIIAVLEIAYMQMKHEECKHCLSHSRKIRKCGRKQLHNHSHHLIFYSMASCLSQIFSSSHAKRAIYCNTTMGLPFGYFGNSFNLSSGKSKMFQLYSLLLDVKIIIFCVKSQYYFEVLTQQFELKITFE